MTQVQVFLRFPELPSGRIRRAPERVQADLGRLAELLSNVDALYTAAFTDVEKTSVTDLERDERGPGGRYPRPDVSLSPGSVVVELAVVVTGGLTAGYGTLQALTKMLRALGRVMGQPHLTERAAEVADRLEYERRQMEARAGIERAALEQERTRIERARLEISATEAPVRADRTLSQRAEWLVLRAGQPDVDVLVTEDDEDNA